MHTIIKADTSVEDALQLTMKGLRMEKREFLDNNKVILKTAHEDYDEKAASGRLNGLKPLWTPPAGTGGNDPHTLAYNLYGSHRTIISRHWENLKSKNSIGADRTLICPCCGLSEATEMDHFVPRSIMPEYSTHLSNLIPLCHDCNHDKGDGWLDYKGTQIYFNAFYDRDIPTEIIRCRIKVMGDLPEITVHLSRKLTGHKATHRRMIATIRSLGLLERFRSEAATVLRKNIEILMKRYEVEHSRYASPMDFYESTMRVFRSHMADRNTVLSFVDIAVYAAIVRSRSFRSFIIGCISKP